jgi:RNA polymerase sigma factor FliA
VASAVRKPQQDNVASLWARWIESRHVADRHALVERYTGFARMLAAKCYSGRISAELEFGDYLQFAMVGLVEAVDRYEPDAGAKFETFAALRINGAILNGVESLSEVQRQASVRHRVVKERAASVASKANAQPASALEKLAEIAIGLALGFALEDSGVYEGSGERMLPDNAYSRLELQQLSQRLADCVKSLPEQQRIVIHRHYFQQMPFEEIAASLNLSKGRVSQVHSAALANLRDLHKRYAAFQLTL